MGVRITDELLEKLRSKSKAERKEIGEVMNLVKTGSGKPHVHSEISIRRLTKAIYECRVGLDERLAFLFVATPPELGFFFLGGHDEIQKMIRANQ